MQKENENVSIGQRINDFIQKNRKTIFIVAGAIIVVFVGSIIIFSLVEVFQKKAIAGAEELNRRYEEVRFRINDETSADEVQTLLVDLNSFAKKNSGIASGRAWSIAGRIHSEKKEWPDAENAWQSAARAASKTYLGPVALFNAAVCAEEQGKNREAMELYIQSVSHKVTFPAAPHAQFAVGRLNETLNDSSGAIEAYRTLLAKWPNVSVWANLAQSRIIALETGEK
jgi:tetratricopeptide (TPR) repeat protein